MAGPGVRLFISCVSGEFGAYRDTLRHALTRPNVEVKIQEDFKPAGGDTLRTLEEYIEHCDAIVHFVGDISGSTPAPSSVEELLARRPTLQVKLERKGLTREALARLTYTQWEAWLAIGFDKYLLIVSPALGVDRGPDYAPSDASRDSQTKHLQRLKAIDRYPIKFTSADNLVATILESAVIEALVKAQSSPITAKRREPFGATTAAIVSGLFVLFIDKLLPLESWFGEFPIFVRVLLACAAGLFAWKAWNYWDILGGAEEPQGSQERADYNALLGELESGGTPAKVYRDWLSKALDRVDVFFGDPGRDDKSWFARALGLETPGARWTAPAFDRCLLLALIYPAVTIVGVWIWSGHVGVAERVLGLWEAPAENLLGGLMRSAFGLGLVSAIYSGWRARRAERTLAKLLWFGAFFVSGAVSGSFSVAVAFTVSVGVAVAVALAGGGAVPGAVGVAFAFAVAFALAGAGAGVFAAAFAVAFGVAVPVAVAVAVAVLVAIRAISDWSVKTGCQGAFLILFFLAATLAAFAGVYFLSSLQNWRGVGALLLIFVVLTLVNAPFDWSAVGLTRALLRRGLAPGGLGPFFYAAVDAIVAPPVIALLAFVAVFAVQTFDDIAVLRAGAQARTWPLGPLFEGLETRPRDPEFWWVWLMLFSTLIPSALNLCIAAASLIRGLPILNTWIVKRMQNSAAMRDSDRLLLASALSAQIAGGVLVTGVALYLIGVWFLPIWLPFLGGYVRDFSDALARDDAPARIIRWLAGVR